MTEPSIASSTPSWEWNDAESTSFEVTLDIIGNVMAFYTSRANQAEGAGDDAAAAMWRDRRSRAATEQAQLRATDPNEVAAVRARYVALYKELRGRDN